LQNLTNTKNHEAKLFKRFSKPCKHETKPLVTTIPTYPNGKKLAKKLANFKSNKNPLASSYWRSQRTIKCFQNGWKNKEMRNSDLIKADGSFEEKERVEEQKTTLVSGKSLVTRY